MHPAAKAHEAEQGASKDATIAEQQLAALAASVNGLAVVNQSVLSVREAIEALKLAQVQAGAATEVLQGKPGYQDWDSYLRHYPTVQAEWNNVVSIDPAKRQWWSNVEDFAQWHYQTSGKDAGWTPYAAGGVFTNGVVSQPTMFDASVMGEDGPEAIMPLVRGPDGLGVRMHGSNDNVDLSELRAELAALRAQGAVNEAKIIQLLAKIERVLTMVTEDGEHMLTTPAA